ncbi:MAG: hypothetical protein Q7U08_06350 [Flavobacteriaceae bacterium]|nr:hypothetical protein [Flavobacteriaceae bacterium]
MSILFSMGHQTMFSYDFDASKISHLTVNGTENICNSDIDFQEFDQNIPLNQDALTKNFLSQNTVQEKVILRSKIALNTWKPPKI